MSFDIPVVFFIFKRKDKSVAIMNRIAQVQPSTIYLISDAGRTPEEQILVDECRRAVENCITWDCRVVKNYADENKGCFDRIGLGALWVFQQESKAIFLEDDNLPELTFFPFCKEMLERYQNDDRILWICGTDYLEEYHAPGHADYVFTHHMHPCGWASWGNKFSQYYDAYFQNATPEHIESIRSSYQNKALFRRDLRNWQMEINNFKRDGRFSSWDYQMCFSLRYYQKLGIVPCKNQIKNIGVDSFSAHGGSSYQDIMTQRFCGMDSKPLTFPLQHPREVAVDPVFERLVDAIVIPPFRYRFTVAFKNRLSILLHKLFRCPLNRSLKEYLFQKRKHHA